MTSAFSITNIFRKHRIQMTTLFPKESTGSLEVILGPMFAGKSSAIISAVKRYEAIRYPVIVLTSAIDTRYSQQEVVNHDFQRIKAIPVERVMPILSTCDYRLAKVVVIEEAQFIPDLYNFVVQAVDFDKKHVIVVGLDGDSDRRPFGDILQLIPLADRVQKLTAYCTLCSDGTPALFSFCTAGKKEQVSIGATDKYMPLCRKHYLEHSGMASPSTISST